MKLIKFIFFWLITLFVIFSFWSKLYDNPYRLAIFHGKKGSGKSSISVKFAIMFQNMKWTVFSDSPIYGCYKLDVNWLGKYDFPEKSLIIVDEGAIAFDNRKFKDFSDAMRNFFVYQRHSKVYVIILTQSFNMLDKKVRELTDDIYVCVNYFNILTIAKSVHKGTGLSQDQDGTGSIAETYTWNLPTSWKFCFIPRWIKFFDSFIIDSKPKVPLKLHEFNNPSEIEKYRSWKYYKFKQLSWLFYQFKNRLYKPIFVSRSDYEILTRIKPSMNGGLGG